MVYLIWLHGVKSRVYFILNYRWKCFTYLTKTIANLTTYSRKPGNYSGTIILQIDIVKKSSPINLNLCQTWLFYKFFGRFFCFDLLLYSMKLSWECCESSRKEVLFWFWHWQKMWILNSVGMSFSWCNLKNNGAIVIPRFSTKCGEVRNSFCDIRETFIGVQMRLFLSMHHAFK